MKTTTGKPRKPPDEPDGSGVGEQTLQILRWNVSRAASEFGMDRQTVGSRIKGAAIEPGSDGCWTTRQICAAIYGDIHGEKLQLTREQRKKVEMQNEETEGRLVSADFFWRKIDDLLLTLRQKITSIPDLSEERKRLILEDLKTAGISHDRPQA